MEAGSVSETLRLVKIPKSINPECYTQLSERFRIGLIPELFNDRRKA
jgi:hypothetical protein